MDGPKLGHAKFVLILSSSGGKTLCRGLDKTNRVKFAINVDCNKLFSLHGSAHKQEFIKPIRSVYTVCLKKHSTSSKITSQHASDSHHDTGFWMRTANLEHCSEVLVGS